MWVLGVANAFNGNDMFSVEAGKRREASVDARMVDLLGGWVELTDNNCASTTTAFAASPTKFKNVGQRRAMMDMESA